MRGRFRGCRDGPGVRRWLRERRRLDRGRKHEIDDDRPGRRRNGGRRRGRGGGQIIGHRFRAWMRGGFRGYRDGPGVRRWLRERRRLDRGRKHEIDDDRPGRRRNGGRRRGRGGGQVIGHRFRAWMRGGFRGYRDGPGVRRWLRERRRLDRGRKHEIDDHRPGRGRRGARYGALYGATRCDDEHRTRCCADHPPTGREDCRPALRHSDANCLPLPWKVLPGSVEFFYLDLVIS